MDMLSKEQAVALMVVTGVILISPKIFLEEIDKKLQRKVTAEEFANPAFILELKELYHDDFLALVYREENNNNNATRIIQTLD